jgi:radical SAM protein with 4Fe4S-binding SPASM domain
MHDQRQPVSPERPPILAAGSAPLPPEAVRPATGPQSRTAPQDHTTAAKLGKQYNHVGAVSTDPDKRASRATDGAVTSAAYAEHARAHRGQRPARGFVPTVQRQVRTIDKTYIDMDYHHPLEDVLDRWLTRKLLGYLTRPRRGRATVLEQMLTSYRNPAAPLGQRVLYWPVHRFIDAMRGGVSAETFRQRIVEHRATLRGLVLAARSVAEFGLRVPQRFSAPLFVVWNFTNLCNLRCRHCYQDSAHERLPSELTLDEKLRLVDEIAAAYIPMVAFAGGEPTISPDLLPVLRRCRDHGIHTTLATHGGTMTPKLAAELAEAQCKYIEISLDSVHPARHDAFRGQPGMWHRTVRGMRTVLDQPGIRLGIAMCVHQQNYGEVEDMLQFATDLGACAFAHFNFIPVGRGLEMASSDLTPAQRERLLMTLNGWMQSGRIGVLSTAPQLGRVCLAHAPLDGQQSASHCGHGGGEKARVISKYVGGCGAGRCYVAIEPDGNVTPCVYLPHRICGNVRERSIVDIFRNNDFWEPLCDRDDRYHHCEVCEFKNYCGGCRARADAYYGDLNAGDPGCIFNDRHWAALVDERLGGAKPEEAAAEAATAAAR